MRIHLAFFEDGWLGRLAGGTNGHSEFHAQADADQECNLTRCPA